MFDSVRAIRAEHGTLLTTLEWTFTILFSIEYLLRLSCIGRPWRYATSFYGIVDLLAVLPTYLSLLVAGCWPESTERQVAFRALARWEDQRLAPQDSRALNLNVLFCLENFYKRFFKKE